MKYTPLPRYKTVHYLDNFTIMAETEKALHIRAPHPDNLGDPDEWIPRQCLEVCDNEVRLIPSWVLRSRLPWKTRQEKQ